MLLQMYGEAHSDAVNSVAFHSTGRYLLSASSDATMKIFDLRKGSLMYSLYGHEGIIQAVNFSRDGTLFGSGGSDCNLILWDSNLIDPEHEAEISRIKKAKNDSKNLGKRTKSSSRPAAEKLRKLQNKRKQATKGAEEKKEIDDDKENDSASANKSSKYETLAEDLAGMMDKITSQLDIITRTIVTLEKRIGDNEEMVNDAYSAFKQHQRNAEIRANISMAQREARAHSEVEERDEDEEESKQGSPQRTASELEATRAKVKNIMNIINISQYSLAAVQKSAKEITETTTKLRHDISPQEESENFRSPIDEESEDDLDRDVPQST